MSVCAITNPLIRLPFRLPIRPRAVWHNGNPGQMLPGSLAAVSSAGPWRHCERNLAASRHSRVRISELTSQILRKDAKNGVRRIDAPRLRTILPVKGVAYPAILRRLCSRHPLRPVARRDALHALHLLELGEHRYVLDEHARVLKPVPAGGRPGKAADGVLE